MHRSKSICLAPTLKKLLAKLYKMVNISKIFANLCHSIGLFYFNFSSLVASIEQADIEMPNESAPEKNGNSRNLWRFFSTQQ